MDDGSIPAEARIRPRPSDPREERVSSSEAILSSEQVVSKEKEKAEAFVYVFEMTTEERGGQC